MRLEWSGWRRAFPGWRWSGGNLGIPSRREAAMTGAPSPQPTNPAAEPDAPQPGRRAVPLAAWAGYFLRLGTLGFGGPIALTAAMQRDLVEERRWITPEEYKEGLALAQLAPGPLAAQLAIYFGWLWRVVL